MIKYTFYFTLSLCAIWIGYELNELRKTFGPIFGFTIAIVITLLIKWIVSQIENPYLEMGVMFFLFIAIIVVIVKNTIGQCSEGYVNGKRENQQNKLE